MQALGLRKFSLHSQDYAGRRGLRIAERHPEWIQLLIIQNSNAYEEGLTPLLEDRRPLGEKSTTGDEGIVLKTFKLKRTQWKYTTEHVTGAISPDAWNMDQRFPGKAEKTYPARTASGLRLQRETLS